MEQAREWPRLRLRDGDAGSAVAAIYMQIYILQQAVIAAASATGSTSPGPGDNDGTVTIL